ncbi:MAG TPA: HD domain-containing phosphohydrolase, partial [Blastocatellia bacterium]|nr:HD domain-containing phosphohydrolase [Blastocatellia bacterium]
MNRSASLVSKSPSGSQRTYVLEQGVFRIGRLEQNDAAIDNPYISRFHAEVIFDGSSYKIKDLGSTSGTFVNGHRVTQSPLSDGDVIRLGRGRGIEFVFDAGRTTDRLGSIPEGVDEEQMNGDQNLKPVWVIAPEDARFLNTSKLPPTPDLGDETVAWLRSLYEFSNDVLTAHTPHELASKLARFLHRTLKADRCAVLLHNRERDSLYVAARSTNRGEGDVNPSRTVTDRIFKDNVAVLSVDARKDERFSDHESVRFQSIRSVMGAPIGSKVHVWGVCYADNIINERPFNTEELEFMTAVARQAGLMMENLCLIEEQRRSLEGFMRTLAASIDARDDNTAGHSARVAAHSSAIARAMGLDAEQCRAIYYAGLLHDYGKIGTRDDVLLKPDRLTPEEYEHVKEHPLHTFRILSKIRFPEDLSEIPFVAAAHHERWDGSGYPHGLKGEEIPFGSRIVAVADAYDAITEDRVYSEGLDPETAADEIKLRAGGYFDPKVVEAFMDYFEKSIKPAHLRKKKKARTGEITIIEPEK